MKKHQYTLIMDDLRKELITLQEHYSKATSEIGHLESQLGVNHYVGLESKNENEILSIAVRKKEEFISDLEKEKDHLRQRIMDLEAKLRDKDLLKYEFSNLQCSFKNKEEYIHQLENQLNNAKMNIDDMENEIASLNEQNRINLIKIDNLCHGNSELEKRVN
jgi:chromosome segregation ATPase